jgi:DnaK suppressor protein
MAKASIKKSAPKSKPPVKKAAAIKKPAKKAVAKKSPPPKKAAPKKKLAASAKKPAPAKKPSPAKKPAPQKKLAVAAKSHQKKPLAKTPVKAPVKMAAPVQTSKAKPSKNQPNLAAKSSIPTGTTVSTPASKAAAPEQSLRGAVSQPNKIQKPIVVPEHLKRLQQQLEGIEEKSTTASSPEDHKIPQSELFTDSELAVFLAGLQEERIKLLSKAQAAVDGGNIALDKDEMYDEVDLASATVDQNLTFRLLDRDRKLLGEIDHAISKIQNGDYGYCEGTGEPIPKRRLELRPWCKYSVKYKEQLERLKKSGRGVVDEDEDVFA